MCIVVHACVAMCVSEYLCTHFSVCQVFSVFVCLCVLGYVAQSWEDEGTFLTKDMMGMILLVAMVTRSQLQDTSATSDTESQDSSFKPKLNRDKKITRFYIFLH